jgi:adenylate cyclase class IV
MEKIEKIIAVIDSIDPDFLKEEVNDDFYYDNPYAAYQDVDFLKEKLLQIYKILKSK